MALQGFSQLLGTASQKDMKDKTLAMIVETYPAAFARLYLWRALSGIIPDPSKDVTVAQYNTLVDRVNSIESVLVVKNYNLMFVKKETTRLRSMTQGETYVPIEDYNALESRVVAIENILSTPGRQIMQVKVKEGQSGPTPIVIAHAKGEYVTTEQFNELVGYVQDLETLLSSTIGTVITVKE